MVTQTKKHSKDKLVDTGTDMMASMILVLDQIFTKYLPGTSSILGARDKK